MIFLANIILNSINIQSITENLANIIWFPTKALIKHNLYNLLKSSLINYRTYRDDTTDNSNLFCIRKPQKSREEVGPK